MVAAYACAVVAQADAGALTLVAVASDVPSAVFKDVRGALHRVAVGETLPDDRWRLVDVIDANAVIKAKRQIDGRDVTMTLPIGEQVKPAAAASIERANAPVQATRVTVTPAKAAPANGKAKNAREGQ